MGNEQLYLSLAGPVLAVALNFGFFLLIWVRLNNVETRMDDKLVRMDDRMRTMEERMDDRMRAMELRMYERLRGMEERTFTRFEVLTGKVTAIDNRLTRVEEHLKMPA